VVQVTDNPVGVAALLQAQGVLKVAEGKLEEAIPVLRQAVEQAVEPAGPQIGEPAPAFSLPDLTGKTRGLADFRGSKILVLFWNPGCGFCQRMLSDLQAWETRPPKGAPRLLVISTGTVEANQALGLRSPIVLDQNMSVGSKFGANGTPMAVLVDAEGRMASEVAAGAPAALALANAGKDPAHPMSA
jgi:peroxiredoxin